MKFATVLASAAALALMADGRGHNIGVNTRTPKYHRHNRSAFAQKRVKEEKDKMELIYGKGLVGLYGADGRIDPTKFGMDRRWIRGPSNLPGEIFVQPPGLDDAISGMSGEALVFGVVHGVQYSGLVETITSTVTNDPVMSNCFWSCKGIISSVEVIINDWNTLGQNSGEYNWANIVMNDPIMIMGDFTVVYEWCNFYEMLDKLVGIASLDWAALGEQMTQIAIYLGAYAQDLFVDIADNLGTDCLDETLAIAQDLIDQGFTELEDYINVGDTEFSVDELMDVIADQGDNAMAILDCVIQDVNLYEVGDDLGYMFARAFQVQLDATN